MTRSKRLLRFAAGFLLAPALAVALLSGLLQICGTNGSLMTAIMLDTAPSASTGLDEALYDDVTLMITRYLAGATDEFQYVATDGYDRPLPLFNEREQAHMADCRALFVLDRTVLLIASMIAAAMFLLCLFRGGRSAAAGCFAGCAAMLLAVTAVAVWALCDFNSVFVLFHHLAFTNDLWLMDPATDLIIRLMPLSFFTRYAAGIGIGWLAGILLAGIVSGRIAFRRGKNRKSNEDRG